MVNGANLESAGPCSRRFEFFLVRFCVGRLIANATWGSLLNDEVQQVLQFMVGAVVSIMSICTPSKLVGVLGFELG